MKPSNEKGSGLIGFIVIVLIFVVLFPILKLNKSISNQGKPITIDQLQNRKKYYVKKLLPEFDLMLVSEHDEYPTKDIWMVRGIPDTVTENCCFVTKKFERLELNGKARKVTEVINLY